MTLFQIAEKYNSEKLNLNDIAELIESNGFQSKDTSTIAKNETHTLEFSEDCITITINKKINLN